MSVLEHYAGALAPVVARLRAAVSRGVGARTSDFLHEWELSGSTAGLLSQLRHTSPGRLAPWANVAAANVYEAPSDVMRGVDDLVERGLIDTDVAGARLTTKGREAVAVLQRITGKVTDELWGEHTAVCEDVAVLLRSVSDAAAETGGETFALAYETEEDEEAPATLVVADLLEPVHQHRFDAHVSAWRSAGLSAQEAQLLTGGTLWRVLQNDTNARDAAPYSVLKGRQRIDLLSGLGSLPS